MNSYIYDRTEKLYFVLTATLVIVIHVCVYAAEYYFYAIIIIIVEVCAHLHFLLLVYYDFVDVVINFLLGAPIAPSQNLMWTVCRPECEATPGFY